jgi:TM2 domain-containing membrane protein YozV
MNNPQYQQAQYAAPVSPKNRIVALILAIFFGGLGVHRFYVGKVGTGILMLITIGGFGIWWIVDIIMIAVGSFTDKAGFFVKQA